MILMRLEMGWLLKLFYYMYIEIYFVTKRPWVLSCGLNFEDVLAEIKICS